VTDGGGGAPRPLAKLLAALLVAGLLYVALREVRSPGDYLGFVAFGRGALDGRLPYGPTLEAIYRPGLDATWATWPPAFAPLAAALALVDRVSRPLGVLLVQAAGLAGLAAALAFFARRMGAGAPAGTRPGAPATPAARPAPLALLCSGPVLLALLVPYRVLLDSLQNTQVNLLVLGLVAAAFWLMRRERRWSGGLTLGAATAFKAAPLLLLGYLAWRGRWKELGAAVVGAAVWWLALPALLVGPSGLLGSFGAWLAQATAGTLLTRGSNQSLLAAMLRVVPDGRPVALAAFAAAVLLLAVVTLVAFGGPFREVSARREAAELAVVLVVVSLLSPLSWKAHFVSLAPLVLVLASEHAAGLGARTALLLALAFGALDLTGRDLVGRALSAGAERWGAVTWAAMALLLAALWRLAGERQSDPPEGAPV
jgi:hypothetical protein